MADANDDFRPDPESEELGGGAVKSFLEHLEDLRWTIIKSTAATLLGMLVCLFNVQRLTAFLEWPLHRAAKRNILFLPVPTNQVVVLQFGGKLLPPFEVASNHWGGIDLGTNHLTTLQATPSVLNGQPVFTWQIIPNPPGTDNSLGPKLIFLDPSAPFLMSLHMAFFAGLLLASPFVLYFIGQFIMPALKIIEKKYFLRAFGFGVFLFLSGCSFAYLVVMPPALRFAELYGNWMGVDTPNWQAEPYMSFVVKFMLGMGLGFELPVVLLALVKIGLLDYEKLSGMRRYMIVGNLILGALLTTPEVFTQVCMALCLQVLFESAVWIAWYWEWKEKKAEEAAQK